MAEKAPLPVHVSARRVRAPASLQQYARDRGRRLLRFDRRIVRVDVLLGLDGKAAAAEVVVHVRGRKVLVGHATAPDGWAAVDQAFAKMQERVKRTKERRRDIRQRRARS
jgi:ribosomal subunit interface protein